MQWFVLHGDILDEPAEVLICSANPFLTLSGGVGGALLLRYGDGLQRELERHLRSVGRRHLDRGSVVVTRPSGTPYRAIIHAVAVDGFYQSSPEVVGSVLRKAMRAAAEAGGTRVAVAALATGYGTLTPAAFATGVSLLAEEAFEPIGRATIVVRKQAEADEIQRVLKSSQVV